MAIDGFRQCAKDVVDKPNSPAVPAGTAFSRPRANAFAWLVLALGLILTSMVAWQQHLRVQADARAGFTKNANRLQADIGARIAAPRQALKAARAAWQASDTSALTRPGFERFVQTLYGDTMPPGVRGIGFIARVQRAELAAFVAAERAYHTPDFTVRSTGDAPDLYVIRYLSPPSANQRARGLDVGAEAVRREAVERAVRTGEPALSGPVSLMQAADRGQGMLYLLPVYRWGANPTTPAERESALVGLLYSPILVADLLHDSMALTTGQIDFWLVDDVPSAVTTQQDTLLAASDEASPILHNSTGPFTRTEPLAVGGRTWSLHTAATPAFLAAQPLHLTWLVGAFGVLLSSLLALLVWRLGGERDRATAHAERATAELAVERQRLTNIIEGTNVATWEWDVATGWVRFDERWAAMIGYTLAELAPVSIQTWQDHAHPDDLAGSGALLAKHFAGETDFYECEARMRHKDGHWIWVLDRGKVATWDGPGQPRMMAGTHMDISDRRAAEDALAYANTVLEDRVVKRTAQLQRAVSDLEDFSYSIAHDIRQPLISLDGFSRLLARELGAQPTAEATHYLERLRAGVRQISDLSDGLLALAHVSTAPLNRQAVDLTTLAREVFAARHSGEPARPATAHIAEGLVAHGDRAQLHKLLAILIDNAFKFSRDQTAVDVSVTMETDGDGREVFHVTDRGTGFDMAHAGRMFEPFQRLHPQTEFPGMGIGLASAHRIVARHNGTIWADATPGTGARFSFTLGAPGSSSSKIGA